MNQYQVSAMMDLTAAIVPILLHPAHVRMVVMDLAKYARMLHKRYEAECSYDWANKDKYQKRTKTIEAKVQEIAKNNSLNIQFQKDPRGWPLIVMVDGREYRLG